MRAEKIVLSFVAVLIGLIAAGVSFYLYQTTKTIPSSKTEPIEIERKPTSEINTDNTNLLKVESPKDEQVFDKRQIKIAGQTMQGSTLIISTEDNDEVVKPASNGDFNLTITIPSGTSLIRITAIFPDGTEKSEFRTVTFSTEDF